MVKQESGTDAVKPSLRHSNNMRWSLRGKTRVDLLSELGEFIEDASCIEENQIQSIVWFLSFLISLLLKICDVFRFLDVSPTHLG